MSRWKAAGTHLTISILVAVLAAILVFGIWYPPPFSDAAGGDKLILVLLGVDLTIGPLLTLIVYRHGKRGMKFDLAVIATLQLAALAYGLSVVANVRPAFIVATIDRLVIVPADALDANDLADAVVPEWRHRPWTGPILVAALPPADAEGHNQLVFSGAGGKDLERFPKYYRRYSDGAQSLLERAHAIDDARHPLVQAAATDWLRAHGRDAAQTRWLPLVGRGGDYTAILDAGDARILDVLAVDPW